jgi:hypothetical protein
MATFRAFVALASLAASVALVACGSSTTEDPADSPAQRFANELASITCAAASKCCGAQGETQDEAKCRTLTAKVELSRGERFDAAIAAKCLSELDGYTCDGDYPADCLQVFYGTTPVGQPCKYQSDCARPDGAMTECVMDADIDHWSCKLVVTSQVGEACGMPSVTPTEIRFCADDLSCGSTCEARIPVGGDCKGALCAHGASCEWDSTASANLCTAYRAVGEDCSDRACVESAWCGADKLCHPKKAAGDACESDAECLEICHPTSHRCTAQDFYCL